MNLIINRFSILYAEKAKAFSETFNLGINLIVGEKDTGKTTLSRSILYTFGCDVKDPSITNNTNIYIIEFRINNEEYILIRQRLKQGRGKNCFKLVERNKSKVSTYYDTKTFKEKLNEIFNIKLVTLDKGGTETKLYPNHIFLPFYTDQDNSWQSYLKDTFTGINFIQDYKKIILEYFTGARSNEYYELKLQKDIFQQQLQRINAIIRSKEMIIEENLKNIKILEDIDIENFKRNYEIVLKMFNTIIESEHKLKAQLNKKIFEKNTLEEMESSLKNSIEEIVEGNLDKECPTCHQNLINSFEENYSLLLVRQNLIKEREKIRLELNDVQNVIYELYGKLDQTINIGDEYKGKLQSDANVISLGERADSYALSRVNIRLENELENDKSEKNSLENQLISIEESLRKLNSVDVTSKYQKLMISAFKDLNIPFAYKNYYKSNLESVNITLSGASKVQAFIAQYLTIYKMSIENKNTVHIPMFIDTFLKDDFNNVEIDKTAKFIFSSIEDVPQSFVFIADNEQTLKSIEDYSFTQFELKNPFNIFNKEYEDVYQHYKGWVE